MSTSRMLFFSSVAAATIAAIACSSSGDDNAINQSGSDGSANADGSSVGDGASSLDGQASGDSMVPPGYTPKSIAGLVLWLEASLGVTTTPTFVWADQSGLGNDAKVAPGSAAPDRNTGSGSNLKGFGFHETEALTIADAPSLQWGTGDFLIEAVATNNYNDPRPDGGTTFTYQEGKYTRRRYGELYSKVATGFGPGPMLIYNDWTDRSRKMIGTVDGQNLLRGSYDTNLHVLGLRRKGGVLELRRDGSVIATLDDAGTPDVSMVGTPVAIGGRSGLTNLVGGIWEMIAVKGPLSDADLAAFEAYAKKKYGL